MAGLDKIGHHPQDGLATGDGDHVRPPGEIEVRQNAREQGGHQRPMEQPGEDGPDRGIDQRPPPSPQGERAEVLEIG